MDETQEIIKEQLVNLPEGLRKAISSVDLRDKIKKVAEKHHLHIDQAGNLETETVLVMLGLEPTDDYKMNIKKELQISGERAQAITFDINKEIFMPIRQSLKKAGDVSPAESGIKNKELGKPKEKPHLETKFPSEGEARPLSESEDIKKQIKQRQEVKKVTVPPTNLPTEPNLGARHPNEEKKPAHVDPYREPIE